VNLKVAVLQLVPDDNPRKSLMLHGSAQMENLLLKARAVPIATLEPHRRVSGADDWLTHWRGNI
jgi:hypothetical protein